VPVYEFTCNACKATVSVFTRSINAPLEPKCDRCGSQDLQRLISRVAVLRSGDAMSMDSLENMDPNDPKAMAAWARQMQAEMGDAGGPEMEQLVQSLERGESLDDFDSGHDHGDDDF
jgi:putative FmdB family regulatory protein